MNFQSQSLHKTAKEDTAAELLTSNDGFPHESTGKFSYISIRKKEAKYTCLIMFTQTDIVSTGVDCGISTCKRRNKDPACYAYSLKLALTGSRRIPHLPVWPDPCEIETGHTVVEHGMPFSGTNSDNKQVFLPTWLNL